MIKKLSKLPKEIEISDTEMLGWKITLTYEKRTERLNTGLCRLYYVCSKWKSCLELVESYDGFEECNRQMLHKLNDNRKGKWLKVKY